MGLQNVGEEKHNENAVTFEEALESAGTGRFQFFVIIVGGFMLLSSYVAVGAVAFILPAAQCDLNMDSEAKGRLASIGFLGLIISCHLWGFLSDTLGRRYILLRCLIGDGLLCILTSLIPYYSIILVLRLINGFVCSGGVISVYAYVGEFQPDRSRIRALMISSMVASFAYFSIPVYASLIIPGEWAINLYPGLVFKSWRLYYAVCSLPSLISALMIYFLPESPKFLVAKGEIAKAIKVFQRIHKVNKKEGEFLANSIKINEEEKVAVLNDKKNKVLAFLGLMWDQTAPLFKEPHRKNITLICLSQYLTYFSNGGMYLWLPETMNRLAIYKNETSNESATFCKVVQYKSRDLSVIKETIQLNDIKDEEEKTCSDSIDFSVYWYLGLLGLTQSINLGAITVLSNLFNKNYLIFGFTLAALISSIAVLEINITDFVAYNVSLLIIFTGAVIPIINSVVVEMFPTNLRAMAGCLTLMSCRLGTVTTNVIAGSLIDTKCNMFLYFFIGAMGVCLVSVSILLIDSLRSEKQNTSAA
ncbi:synaptic vesicle glycoprotein 2C-like [Lycorma delicatula]|uniref:synaptic vesicle glycoprotein 2C-like n=1 Tax=Lycorma delicatula TaxID=130591 RepID=UPI003F517E69